MNPENAEENLSDTAELVFRLGKSCWKGERFYQDNRDLAYSCIKEIFCFIISIQSIFNYGVETDQGVCYNSYKSYFSKNTCDKTPLAIVLYLERVQYEKRW